MKKDSSGGNTLRRVLLAVLVLLFLSFAGLLWYAYQPPSAAEELSLDQVYELAANGKIRSAVLLDEDAVVVGKRCLGGSRGGSSRDMTAGAASEEFPSERRPCAPPLEEFQARYPSSDAGTQSLIWRMAVGGANVEVDPQTPTVIVKQVTTYVYPVLFLATVFGLIFLTRSGGESGMGDVAGFGSFRKGQPARAKDVDKSGRRLRTILKRQPRSPSPARRAVTFADVAGADEAIVELREVTDYLKDPDKFAAYGAVAPKGVLLFGPPGCGKTLLARAVSGEAGVPFFAVSGAEFIESLVGVGAARVRDLFAQVRQFAPAIVFIDEIDAVGRKRGSDGGGGGEREQTINQLLVEMDGFDVSAGIVLMAATNRPDILDPALLRPGRFDRHVTLEPPDFTGREAILRMHAKGKPLADDVDFGVLAKRTLGFTGADLANVVNEAALLAIRQGTAKIDMTHLAEAIERVLHGPRRRGKIMNSDERRRLAYHESGHALVAAAVGHAGGVQRVSILARGRGLGSSMISHDLGDRILLAVIDVRASLAMAMGGIAAERLVFDDQSTTAEDDLDKANAIAREMVGIHGMSDEVGPLRLLRPEEGFLGADVRLVEAVSGQTLGLFDAAVRARIEDGQALAADILTANRDQLDAVARTLEQQEILEGEQLTLLLASVTPWDLANTNGGSGNGEQNNGRGAVATTSGSSGRRRTARD